MYLFFDTETTGLPKDWNAPVTNVNNWPRMVQIAWLVYNDKGERVGGEQHIIKPEGYTIPLEASRVHGISTERAMKEGHDLTQVLEQFVLALQSATCLVAHNISFDEKIVGAELVRKQIKSNLFGVKQVCTMRSSADYCKLPGKMGNYKWPNLTELHTKLFKKGFENAHDALADVIACADCFFELKRLRVITA